MSRVARDRNVGQPGIHLPEWGKRRHRFCAACYLHARAHGTWDGFSLARVLLIGAGYDEAASVLDAKQKRAVNTEVRKIGRILGIDQDAMAALMRHHGGKPR